MATTKTKLEDLNAHLFGQLERLSNAKLTGEEIDQEATKATAIVAVADQILRGAELHLKAAKILSDHGLDPSTHLPALEQKKP